MGQSRLSNMQNQSQYSASDIQALEDLDPNDARFDSRKPIASNLKNYIQQRNKLDATLSAGRTSGQAATPYANEPIENPYKTQSTAWFAPVVNGLEDKVYAEIRDTPAYKKAKNKSSYYQQQLSKQEIVPSVFTDYARQLRNPDGSPMIGKMGGFTDRMKGVDLAQYINKLSVANAEINKNNPGENVWTRIPVPVEKPGANTTYNIAEKENYEREFGRIDAENKRRSEMGYSAELTTSPGNAAEAAIIAEKARQGKIEGQLDWGRPVWDKELGKVRGTVAQVPSFSEPLPPTAYPKTPTYKEDGGGLEMLTVPAGVKEPPTPRSPGTNIRTESYKLVHPEKVDFGKNAAEGKDGLSAVQSYGLDPVPATWSAALISNKKFFSGGKFKYNDTTVDIPQDFTNEFNKEVRKEGTIENKLYKNYQVLINSTPYPLASSSTNKANYNKNQGMSENTVFANARFENYYGNNNHIVPIKVIDKNDPDQKQKTWYITANMYDPTSYVKNLQQIRNANPNYYIKGDPLFNQAIAQYAAEAADEAEATGKIKYTLEEHSIDNSEERAKAKANFMQHYLKSLSSFTPTQPTGRGN